MALHEMPNGEYVDIDDGATPEVIASVKKQYSGASRKSRPTGKSRTEIARDKRIADTRQVNRELVTHNLPFGIGAAIKGLDQFGARDVGDTVSDFAQGVGRGGTLSFIDEIAGAGSALTGQGYKQGRDTARAVDREARERSPFAHGAGELSGAVALPFGMAGRAAQGVGNVAGKYGLEAAANALGRSAQALKGGGAVRQGVIAGAEQGALNAAGSAEEMGDVPEALLSGGALGGLAGGAIGGVVHAGRRGLQIMRDTGPEAASRAAYSRVAKLLDNAGMTPEQAAQAAKLGNEAGSDMRVIDTTRGLQAQGTSLARKPDVRGSDDLISMGLERSAGRRGRFSDEVRTQSGVTDDALSRREDMVSARKDVAQKDYAEGGALDTQINWSDDLNKFFRDAPDSEKFVRNAYTNAQRFGDDIGRMADEAGQIVPSMRAFDYLKREFDDAIGAALNRKERSLAAGYSNQLTKLKGIIADANPEYGEVLARQRDAFQAEKALEMGEATIRRLTSEPRKLLKDVRGMTPAQLQEWRVGVIDTLANWERKGDPVKVFRDALAVPAQRKILETAFGGKGNLGRMERWINRESKAALTDAKVSGPQAITSEALLAEGADTVPTKADVIKNAFRGLGFGGVVGAAGNALSTLGRMANGTNRLTQEEIIKVLMSRGDDLVPGTEAAAAYAKSREAGNSRWSRVASKAGQQPFTDATGD